MNKQKTAILFPGQGSQVPGMGKDLAEHHEAAAAVFQAADRALNEPFSELVFHGAEEELKKTANTQPALLTAGIAIWRVLQEKGVDAEYTAGHSLGEYASLVAAEALPFDEAVCAVRKRGEFMEEAVPEGSGAMAAVLGMERADLESVTEEAAQTAGAVEPANYNAPGQIVISGSREGVEKAVGLAKERGAKKAVMLNVSGPFHSSLMKPAADKMEQELNGLTISPLQRTVIANVSASAYSSAEQVTSSLTEQIHAPVKWEETIQTLVDEGVDTFIEAGPGKVLSGLVKKVSRRATVLPVYDEETLNAALEKLAID
ncbi:ACP S-malonyltransferase [Salisediminibacterium halotolerans]|uniref:ACP S-malonyltransferase n=1 Tax=Salisediminibacterium halotolerans TaxID=517425 RepID=UPI000EB1B711|nr:ACP S-malonyltransferase [Salisediminibacterium halotolerans]RLJ74259.1 [acyl-carrier-protein] S-malonyltransferase [Actinophytocola xinjiangensis]RPE87649.1 [acyl-carrier-protein] S-malonyltransferase [Salisediminibacterium halotolerans]TWG35096.1 [acyl-carrier-protein] S-malonyltransferase [Salisediminibacterium halotolerans]GEL06856.1 malonyl CoA-acyl carrier protein transacylase [Salisediminibacterium halotolerans]